MKVGFQIKYINKVILLEKILERNKNKFNILPVQKLIFAFSSVILLGAIALTLPIASKTGECVSFIDALFTATSAVCVTGLVVVDTFNTYTIFGQIVIILLIQMGGLGIMTITTAVFLLFGKRITLKERLVLAEQYNMDNLQGMIKLTLGVLLVTLFFEACGTVILSFRFVPVYGLGTGIFYGIFHSISAFCNAGFDLMGNFGNYSSLVPFQNDPVMILTIGFLIIFGGIGFAVITDVFHSKKQKKVSLQTKCVLVTTAILLILGTVFFALAEWHNPKTLGNPDMSIPNKLVNAFFQSVTPRTAGYDAIGNVGLTMPSKFMTMILMFIGASPGSTGGGIKTTTFFVAMLFVYATFRGKTDYTIFKKRLLTRQVMRALTIILLAAMVVIIGAMLLMVFEQAQLAAGSFGLEDIMYDVISAFGTVGLTLGITPLLSLGSKLVLIIIMFIGRVGPLTIAIAIANKLSENKNMFHYPEDRMMIG